MAGGGPGARGGREERGRRGRTRSADQVEREPVHEQRLCGRHRHGQVHAQLVPRAAHRHALGRRLGQDLQPQRPDLGGVGEHRSAWGALGARQPYPAAAWPSCFRLP